MYCFITVAGSDQKFILYFLSLSGRLLFLLRGLFSLIYSTIHLLGTLFLEIAKVLYVICELGFIVGFLILEEIDKKLSCFCGIVTWGFELLVLLCFH